MPLEPPFPAAFKYKDMLKTHLYKLACHPGTGVFERSRAVEHEGLIVSIVSCPPLDILLIFTHRPQDLLIAPLPVACTANIYNGNIRIAELCIKLLSRYLRGASYGDPGGQQTEYSHTYDERHYHPYDPFNASLLYCKVSKRYHCRLTRRPSQ